MKIDIDNLLGEGEGNLYLGTAVKIETTFETAPDSVTISIRTPSGILVVEDVAMTEEIDTFYNYVYQSVVGGVEGDYIVTVKAVLGAYTEVGETTFNLVRQAFQ